MLEWFFDSRPRGHMRSPHSVIASLHPWHELLMPEPLVVAGWIMAADSRRTAGLSVHPRSHERRDARRARSTPTVAAHDDDAGENMCTICLLDVGKEGGTMGVSRLHCGHEFHPLCIAAWFERSPEHRCPLCRAVEGSALEQRDDGSTLPRARPRSLFVSARNVAAWLLLHHQFHNMTAGFGFDRTMALTSSPLLSCVVGMGWVILLHKAIPPPRAAQNPVQVLLGVRNTPHVLRVWTSWIR